MAVAIDFLMVSAAVIAAANLRWYPPTGSWNLDRNDLAPWTGVAIAAVWMAMLALGETYDSEVMGAGTEEMGKVALSGFTTAAVTAITLYLVKFPLSRIFFVLTIVLALSAAITSALGATETSRVLGGIALVLVGLGMLASLRLSARSLVVNAPRLRLEAGLALLPLDREQGIAALLQLLDDTPEAPRAWAGRIERALAS